MRFHRFGGHRQRRGNLPVGHAVLPAHLEYSFSYGRKVIDGFRYSLLQFGAVHFFIGTVDPFLNFQRIDTSRRRIFMVILSQIIDKDRSGYPEQLGGEGVLLPQGLAALPELGKRHLYHLFRDIFGFRLVKNEEIKFLMVLIEYLPEVRFITILQFLSTKQFY